MPTDVSGTISIIAEVIGNTNSPVAGTGSVIPSEDKKKNDANSKGILDMAVSVRKMIKLVGLGGILSQSKILSTSLGTSVRLFGTLVDIFIMPIAPLLVRGLVIFGKVVRWFSTLFDHGPIEHMKILWGGLVDWVKYSWNEKGGILGVFKEGAKNYTGVALLSSLFAATLFGPTKGLKLLKLFFGPGIWIAKKTIKAALGLVQFAGKKAWSIARFTGQRIFDFSPAWVKRTMLGTQALFGKMFASGKAGAIFAKAAVMRYMGFAAGKVSTFARLGWSALMGLGGGLRIAATAFTSWLGGLGIFATMGSAAAAALPFLLVGLLITGAAVSAVWIIDYMMRKYLGFGVVDATARGGKIRLEQLQEAEDQLYHPRNITDMIKGLVNLIALLPSEGGDAGLDQFATGTGDLVVEKNRVKTEALEVAPAKP
jgi:hypothetical protein